MTLADAQEKLATWQARLDGLERQQLVSGKTTEVSLSINQALKMVQYYEGEVERLEKGRRRGARQMRFVPRDY
jgi:hypothetical protein